MADKKKWLGLAAVGAAIAAFVARVSKRDSRKAAPEETDNSAEISTE